MNLASRYSQPVTHFEVSSILRSSEKVAVSIPCRVRVDDSKYHKAEAAIVVNASSGRQHGAVIVIVPGHDGESIRIPYFLAITRGFKHYLNQTPPSPSTSFFHQSSRPHITLTLHKAQEKVDLRISAAQSVRVQAFIAELRQLLLNAGSRNYDQYMWMDFYPLERPSLDSQTGDVSGTEEMSPQESSTSTLLSPSTSTSTLDGLASTLTSTKLIENDTSGQNEEFPNPLVPGFSRVAFTRKRLFAKQDSWSSRQSIRIRLATYNVNDKLPPPGTTELAPLVGQGEEDLLVFGLQEMDLRSSALLISQGKGRADEWEAALLRGLGSKADEYEKVTMTQYVGVMTIVFVRKSLRPAITRIETSERGIGLLGFGGNKAGVAVRFKVHDSTVCFVNSHLAAFAAALERRRADYQVLLKGLTFLRDLPTDIQPAFEEFPPEVTDRPMSPEDAHALFWLGDLNYRIDMEEDILRAWVTEEKWRAILEKDQLRADIASGKSFAGFQEHAIDFPPSFKYVHGSTTFDNRRSPAYTDRIIWSNPDPATIHSSPAEVQCSSYTSHPIMWSDHRPVSASVETTVRVVDEDKRLEEYVAVERELERLEEMYRPALEVEEMHLSFGSVSCLRPFVQKVTLRNKGRVPATYGFKPPSPDKPFCQYASFTLIHPRITECKATLWPFPRTATLEPGEEVVLRVVMVVDVDQTADLTLGEETLDDVLVLRVLDGADTFITFQATFLPTILGLPLGYLVALPGPIRLTDLAKRKELGAPHDDAYEVKPKGARPVREIWRLLEYLMVHGVGVKRLWTSRVDLMVTLAVLDNLDTGEVLETATSAAHAHESGDSKDSQDKDDSHHLAQSVAGCLLLILVSLPEPLVSNAKAKDCELAQDRDEAFAALEGVPQVNTNVLIGVMSVIRLCLSHRSGGASQPENNTSESHIPRPPSQATSQANLDLTPKSPMAELPTPPLSPLRENGSADPGRPMTPPNQRSISISGMEARLPHVRLVEPPSTKRTLSQPNGGKSFMSLAEEVESEEHLDEVVDAILPVVFGASEILGPGWRLVGKKRFVKLLLEG